MVLIPGIGERKYYVRCLVNFYVKSINKVQLNLNGLRFFKQQIISLGCKIIPSVYQLFTYEKTFVSPGFNSFLF